MDYLQRGINRCVEPCGGGGGITAGDNVGGGPGEVFRDITAGTTFNLRTILSPTGTVSIVTNGDVVELEATASNVGGGEGIFAGQVLADKQFKTLTSTGATVTITSTATTVNLEAVGGGGGEVNTASNIGAGTGVFSSKVGTDLEFKSLTSSDASITISASATEIDLTTAGGGGGITPAQHETLRQLIHFIDDGPGNGFTTGALKETLPAGVPFPTQFIWWESAAKTNKIVELQITRNPNQTPATELWTMYSGGAPVGTVSDTITYAANVFEVSRTRAIAP